MTNQQGQFTSVAISIKLGKTHASILNAFEKMANKLQIDPTTYMVAMEDAYYYDLTKELALTLMMQFSDDLRLNFINYMLDLHPEFMSNVDLKLPRKGTLPKKFRI